MKRPKRRPLNEYFEDNQEEVASKLITHFIFYFCLNDQITAKLKENCNSFGFKNDNKKIKSRQKNK